MDHDFYIELVARHGLEPLEPFLGEMPFEILLSPDLDSSAVALVQGAVSEFAGFGAAAPVRGDRHFYEDVPFLFTVEPLKTSSRAYRCARI